MEEKRTGLFENGLIWFGAGVSIAEILTGTYLAPLGMGKGLLAIIIGHIIGCLMLFLAGVIGGKVRKSAMETVKMSFGQKGSILFAVLNVLQLVGWTAIMIYDGALAADGVMNTGRWIWCLVIGALIILWIVIGITNLGKINTVAMAALFILTLILCKVIFTGSGAGVPSDDSMTFGAAVELAVAMPLSWLPLISDYTREAKEPVKATAVSAITYGIVSCWMYVIGMGAAIITGEYDIAQIMLKAGLGIAGLLIIVFSTVTTTFLDAYSAGISSETVVNKWNGKHVAIVVTVLGTIAAGKPITAIEQIENYILFSGYQGSASDLFALHVRGESMIEAGILDGDLIIVRKTPVAENGEIVVALIDDEATVKRFYKENGCFRLQPENSQMEPIIVDQVVILGRVIAVIRSYE